MRAPTIGTLLMLVLGLGLLLQAQEVSLSGSGSQPQPFRQSDLVMVAVDGSTEYRLTDTLMSEGAAAWSPDGSRVIFTGNKRRNDLFVVNVDGSGLVNLTNTPEVDERTASWSPDGRRIVFSAGTYTTRQREGSNIITRSLDTTNIHVMNADGSDRQQLTYDDSRNYGPKFSPDGRSIAFASGRAGLTEIFVMDADGSNVRRITHSPEGIYCDQPSWSVGAVQIAYIRHEGHLLSDIYVTNADASRTFQITDTPEFETDPAWSPSGSWIAFSAGLGRAHQVYCVHPNGQNTIRITNQLDKWYTGPSWSPDENFIVAQTRLEPGKKRPLTAFTLWDSGGLSIQAAGDDTSRFIGGTRHPDGSVTMRPLSEAEGRAWFVRHDIPFPELPKP